MLKALDPIFEIQNPYSPSVQGQLKVGFGVFLGSKKTLAKKIMAKQIANF